MNLEEKVEIYNDTTLSIAIASESSIARFIIIEESCSGHCCFEYTVIDTHIKHDDTWRRTMCETFDKVKAEIICNALNQHFQ